MKIDLTYVLKQTFYRHIKWCRTWMEIMSQFRAGGSMGAISIGEAGDMKQNKNKYKLIIKKKKEYSATDNLKLRKRSKMNINSS